MTQYTAFLDACVLVPITPVDTLLRLANTGAFQPIWSQRVIDEAQYAIQFIHPDINVDKIHSRFDSMNIAFENALITGWESLENTIHLPDLNDRHVVAAAVTGKADAIITENTKDFPESALRPYGLKAVRLDDFLLRNFKRNPETTYQLILEQRQAMTNPLVSLEELIHTLEKNQILKFTKVLKEYIHRNHNS